MTIGNAKTWAVKLAERCEAAGLTVVRTSDGYLARGPEGKTAAWHSTQSDRNSREHVERDLDKMGLSRMETALAAEKVAERKAVIAADRKRTESTQPIEADAATRRAAKRQAFLRRATGEYAVHDDEQWPFMKHPSPACRLMLVTPALAEMMLERNTHNRPTKSRHLKGLRHAAVEGHFMLTHQGIAFDSNGVLCDGQHRLRMISETEIGQYLFVFVGIDPEAFQYIDTHAKRSGSDTLATRGNVKYANNAAALARFIHVYDHYSPNAWGQAIVDNGDVAKTYDADPENMTWACAEASKTRIAHKGFSPNAIAGLIYLVRRQGATLQDIEDFLYGYRTGEDLRRGHPILALRREADKNRDRMGTAVKMKIQFGQWVMAWNATQEGRQMSALTHRLDDALPPLSIRK